MTNREFHEKDEKDEKERSKHDEKTVEEKYRRDPLSALIWGAILVWAGIVFLAVNLGWVDALFRSSQIFPGLPGMFYPEAWGLVFVGAGLIVLVGVVIRLAVPAYRAAVGGSVIFGLILIGIGLGNMFGWDVTWPLIIIGIGVLVLVRAFLRRT